MLQFFKKGTKFLSIPATERFLFQNQLLSFQEKYQPYLSAPCPDKRIKVTYHLHPQK